MQIRAIQPAQPTPLITLKNIKCGLRTKRRHCGILILAFIRIRLSPLLGQMGGGKSTLLKTLLKLQTPTSGEVIYSQNVKIGYVPQKNSPRSQLTDDG